MRNNIFYILLVFLVSCSNKDRSGLLENERNYDQAILKNTRCSVGQPSDAIYIFKENIHKVISDRLISLCDSILGSGFVNMYDIGQVQANLDAETARFKQPNPEITIDSKNVQIDLRMNENGYSSLEYRDGDLHSSSPLQFKLDKILTLAAINKGFAIEESGYKIEITTRICMNTLLTRKGIYTISRLKQNDKIPNYKYFGKALIKIALQITNINSGKTEYYFTEINSFCDHYTASQYLPSDGVRYN